MKISMNAVLNKLIWLLTVFLFATFLIFDTYTWGRYAFLGASALILLLSAFVNGGKISVRMCPYYGFFAIFIVYVVSTALWAWNSSLAVSKAVTLVQVFGCSAMLYIHYDQQGDVWGLLKAIKWAGYIVAVYAIFYYGFENLGLEEGTRIGNEFANINGIGMAAALSCVFQVHELLYKKSKWSAIMIIPAVIMVAATQSRTALIALLVGCIGVCLVCALSRGSISKRMGKAIFFAVGVVVGFYFVLKLPIFDGLMSRMDTMIAAWSGEGDADHSAVLRNQMIELGKQCFYEHPIGGIGIGNTSVLILQHLGYANTYLHNNYIELLASGGVIGFSLYYGMYVYVLACLLKYRKVDAQIFTIGLVWLGITLGMHYGTVAYYTKLDWYHLMTMFLLVEGLKKKERKDQDETAKIT